LEKGYSKWRNCHILILQKVPISFKTFLRNYSKVFIIIPEDLHYFIYYPPNILKDIWFSMAQHLARSQLIANGHCL